MQKSITHSVPCSGISITGQHKTTVTLFPAPPDTGIVFVRDDLPGKPQVECKTKYARTDSRWTSLVKNNIHIEHTEHILAAITGLGIDNIKIHMDSSHIPVVSQFSSASFVNALLQAEPVLQHIPKRYLTVTEPKWVFDSFTYQGERYDSILMALPNRQPMFTYLLEYPGNQLPTQLANYKHTTDLAFASELSEARSYIIDYEYDQVAKLIGSSIDQCLVFSNGTANKLRWDNEPARHKLVDLIGDLTTIGIPVQGHFIGIRTGHKTNIMMAKKLFEGFGGDVR
ncbi:UDP-3-O-acyl-N-acetylglucosamine deacetylase [Metabacillus herbersteinensis]|uniref:UDP-3-O-acyl-N-acetylglucosamine deacetylase n=1 Tax=Metabacillus herbersteinensis TaxID=283816 RepID=A0ABV6GHJ9_9BACI